MRYHKSLTAHKTYVKKTFRYYLRKIREDRRGAGALNFANLILLRYG